MTGLASRNRYFAQPRMTEPHPGELEYLYYGGYHRAVKTVTHDTPVRKPAPYYRNHEPQTRHR